MEENNKEIADEMPDSAETASDQSGEIKHKRNKKADFIAKILCFVIAFILWYLAADNSNTVFEKEISSVPVEIRGINELSVLSGDGAAVDVTVSGKRGTLNKLGSDDIKAYVDISGITQAGECKLPISYELPGEVTYAGGSSDIVILYLDKKASRSVPIQVNVTNYLLSDGFCIGFDDIQTEASNTTVTGPETIVSTIEKAVLTADLGDKYIENSVVCNGQITLTDSGGNTVESKYLNTSTSSVSVTIPVYERRNIPVNISFTHGFYNDKNCKLTVEPSVIEVIGSTASVRSTEFSYTINDREISGTKEYTFDFVLPNGVKSTEEVKNISVKIEPVGMTGRSIRPSDLTFIGSGQEYEAAELPMVSIYGSIHDINTITSEDIRLTAYISEIENDSVPVKVSFSDKYEGKVYELGTYRVKVAVSPGQ